MYVDSGKGHRKTPDETGQKILRSLLQMVELGDRSTGQNSVSKPKDKVTLRAQVDAKKLMITIEDQGPGIASTIIDSLFEPFSTTSANGTGLGLSIAKNTIEAHRGTISVENSPHGAIFKITLPITSE